jgi:hypothetical protein
MDVLHVDCDRCIARGPACSDCVISVLLEPPAELVNLDSDDRAALSALADQGLVPPLRLIPAVRSANATSPPGWQNYA